jgi:hypothetical protein
VWESGTSWHEYQNEGRKVVREPDYAHPTYRKVYLPHLQRFLEALAARYCGPQNAINLLGCMGYGNWGEWHTMWSDYVWPDLETKRSILKDIVDLYADTFRHCTLSISYATDTFHYGRMGHESRHQDITPGGLDGRFLDMVMAETAAQKMHRQAIDVAVARGFALSRHGFIDGLTHADRAIMNECWKRVPMFAEADHAYEDMRDDGSHGTINENHDVVVAWHSNYWQTYLDCHGYRGMTPEHTESFARLLSPGGMGYRLVLHEVEWPDRIRAGDLLVLHQRWENLNTGRLHERHAFKLYLIDASGTEHHQQLDRWFDPTSWVQGEQNETHSMFQLPSDLTPGTYDLRIALVDLVAQEPRIRLGIDGVDD